MKLTRRNFLLGSTALVGAALLPVLAIGPGPVWREAGDVWGKPYIARITYWNRRLSDNTLKALTA